MRKKKGYMAKKNKFPKQLELFPKLPKFFPNDLADGGGTAYDPKDDREVDGFLKNKSKTLMNKQNPSMLHGRDEFDIIYDTMNIFEKGTFNHNHKKEYGKTYIDERNRRRFKKDN